MSSKRISRGFSLQSDVLIVYNSFGIARLFFRITIIIIIIIKTGRLNVEVQGHGTIKARPKITV